MENNTGIRMNDTNNELKISQSALNKGFFVENIQKEIERKINNE